MAGRSSKPRRSKLSRRGFLQKTGFAAIAALIPSRVAPQNPVGNIYGEGLPACRVQFPKVKPAYPVDASLVRAFVEMSEGLTGVYSLHKSPNLAAAYADRIATNPALTSALPPLLDAFRQIPPRPRPPHDSPHEIEAWEGKIDAAIMKNPQLRPCAEQVIYVWYFSAFFLPNLAEPDPNKRKKIWLYGDYDHYARGLAWSLIGAHAPGVTGGPYGYWADTVTL